MHSFINFEFKKKREKLQRQNQTIGWKPQAIMDTDK